MTRVLALRLVCVLLAFFMSSNVAVSQGAGSLAVPDTTAAAPATLPPRPLPDLTEAPDLGAAFERSLDLYAHFRDIDPRIEDRVLSLGLDPARAFALIRDQVQSQPYGGHLRDTSSVFAAAGGNAYDKSLALADLLSRMGYDTQLVAGQAPSAALPEMSCGTGTVPTESWQLTRLGPEVLDRVPLRAAASYAVLRDYLDPQDAAMAATTEPHVWVQMRDGADWVDLDPWLPGTAYGDSPAGPGILLTSPPQPHSVSLSVVVETLTEGRLETTEVLSQSLELPLAAESLVALYFGADAEGAGGGALAALDALQGNAGQMAPFLMINDEIQKGRAFATPGPVQPAADGFFAEGGVAGVTTAVWLDVTTRAPGMPDHSETRWVIDLLPAELRHSLPETIDPAALLAPTPGTVFPAAIEGLRHFMISNGGTPMRFYAAEEAKQIVGLPEVLDRVYAGIPNPYDAIWAAYLEAGRVQLAAELLIRARPAHLGTCAVLGSPRVLMWGVTGVENQRVLRWLDWTIDDINLMGGDARARAEAQLWHGTIQAALEKEALMQQLLLADDSVPLDEGVMEPLTADRLAMLGTEGTNDIERGYSVLAHAAMPDDVWWRINPQNGLADARGRFRGNLWYNYINSTVNTGSRIIVLEDPALARLQGDQVWQEIMRQERQRAALQAAQPKCGGNEYMILSTCVSIPGSIAAGVIGIVVLYGLYSWFTL